MMVVSLFSNRSAFHLVSFDLFISYHALLMLNLAVQAIFKYLLLFSTFYQFFNATSADVLLNNTVFYQL